ncbi:LrgB family protein [Agitococcus lubricus]|uniref:Putative effector of murein hydrolase n=1 Tax=Agitococcus lubricus TaxID=1077255 RepID=A0A2T5IYN8_9GAMM|nr:LrgB family protein [Agitococcus lubricus]PTQ89133.1 putative effector of murein hydrolase [Agitococcus lubricus]
MESLLQSPLLWMTVTLVCYEAGFWLHRRCKEPVLVPPMLISLTLLVSVLVCAQVDYMQYFQANQFIHFLLGTSTVALAVPLYQSLARLKAAALPLSLVLVIGSVLGAGVALGLAVLSQLSHTSVLAFATRAVTTPMALGIAEKIHAPLALASAIVIVSGLVGAIVAEPLLKFVKHDMAKGFALGIAAHGVGTARALQISPVAGAFAALGMSLNGILTALWLPTFVHWCFT